MIGGNPTHDYFLPWEVPYFFLPIIPGNNAYITRIRGAGPNQSGGSATSEYTVTPCAGGGDIGVDDPSVVAGGFGDFVMYSSGGNSYCGEITGGTFSGASSGDIDDGGYADCADCESMLP
tara:strand:+ start:290 stop:649 length:360 start_codon:yes stop_codon:yes gene_type:complete